MRDVWDILPGPCMANGKGVERCMHSIQVRHSSSGAWEFPSGVAMVKGVDILRMFNKLSEFLFNQHGAVSPLRPECGLNEDQIVRREHFLEYKNCLAVGQKRKGKYNKKPKGAKPLALRSKMETSASAAAAPAAGGKSSRKSRPTGDVMGTGRALNSKNKRRQRARNYEKGKAHPLEIQNVVCKGTTHPNMSQEMIKLAMGGSHEEQKFPASVVNYKQLNGKGPEADRATVSYSSSGEISVTGANTREGALLAATVFVKEICDLEGLPFHLINFAPVNFATSMRLEGTIDNRMFEREHGHRLEIIYHPTKFKGLIWQLTNDNVVVVIFEAGSMNIVGLKNEKHVRFARDQLCPLIEREVHRCVRSDTGVIEGEFTEEELEKLKELRAKHGEPGQFFSSE